MNREQREAELFEREGEIAKRIIDWFELLPKFRKAAEQGPETWAAVRAEMLRADPAMLHHDAMWMIKIFSERYILGRAQLDRGRIPKITADGYSKAWNRSPTGSVSDVARRMKVSRTALQNWLKENPAERLPKKK